MTDDPKKTMLGWAAGNDPAEADTELNSPLPAYLQYSPQQLYPQATLAQQQQYGHVHAQPAYPPSYGQPAPSSYAQGTASQAQPYAQQGTASSPPSFEPPPPQQGYDAQPRSSQQGYDSQVASPYPPQGCDSEQGSPPQGYDSLVASPYPPQGYDVQPRSPQQGYDAQPQSPQQGYDSQSQSPQQGYDSQSQSPQQGYDSQSQSPQQGYDSQSQSPYAQQHSPWQAPDAQQPYPSSVQASPQQGYAQQPYPSSVHASPQQGYAQQPPHDHAQAQHSYAQQAPHDQTQALQGYPQQPTLDQAQHGYPQRARRDHAQAQHSYPQQALRDHAQAQHGHAQQPSHAHGYAASPHGYPQQASAAASYHQADPAAPPIAAAPHASKSRPPKRPIAGADATTGVPERVKFIRRTYLHLLGAILAFAGLLYLLMTNATLVTKVSAPLVKFALGGRWNWGVVLAVFMAVSWVADTWASHAKSKAMQYLGLGIYVVAEALIFVPLLAIVAWKTQALLAKGGGNPNIIRDSAFVTLGIFTALTGSVFLTRKDFSFLRSSLVMASGAAMMLIILSLTFGFNLGLVFSVAMVLLAAAYILYQTSQVLAHYDPSQHVAASLALFSSVALMFWYVIRIFMRARE